MKKITGVLFSVLFLVLAGSVMAQMAIPKGGSGFNSAVLITPGEYITDRELALDEYEFYTISVTKGQVVRVKITTGSNGYGDAAIYDNEKQKLASEVMIDVNDSVTLNAQAKSDGIMYISIGGRYGTYAGNTYTISLEKSMPTPTSEEGLATGSTEILPEQQNSNPNLLTTKVMSSLMIPAVVVIGVIVVVGVLIARKTGSKKKGKK